MSEMRRVNIVSNLLFHSYATEPTEPGGMDIDEVIDTPSAVAPAPSATMVPVPAAAQQKSNRTATVEHLAARRNLPELNANTPEVKQTISDLRTELTMLVTDLRWGGQSVKDTADRIIPLLNVGSLQQWIPVLVPNIWEIDRAGDLIPAWLSIIGQEDPIDLPIDANPAETMVGRARRIALLMLGFYKSADISEVLGKLSTDSSSSLYATRSLVKQATVAALQALANALKEAKGWAKVDVIDAFATLNLARFYEIMLINGLDHANGLESYLAVPLFRTLPIENYLRGGNNIPPRLSQQAALVVNQILQDSMSYAGNNSLPLIFERNLPTLTSALFDGAKNSLQWQFVIALHRLGLLLGRYWGDISRGTLQDQRIVQQVYDSLPMMPDIERWMNNGGRDILLKELNNQEEGAFLPSLKVLSDLHEPRVSQALVDRLDATMHITERDQASLIGQICDTLVQLQDSRAIGSIRELVKRTISVDERAMREKRRDNLANGDTEIPGSIVYGAAIRTFAQFGDRSTLDFILKAANDFDPYIRAQALEALKSIDPQGEDPHTRPVVRDALNDPHDTVVRIACQLITQYHDIESETALRLLATTRPEFASSVQETLRQLV
ncbi:MAG TPA: HEAT repeat domain-containing protein [Ktedonobacteraceae bacterium]|nr:HEAT repeat domain-containing protein [Ktedonobacteraceae bacterium]